LANQDNFGRVYSQLSSVTSVDLPRIESEAQKLAESEQTGDAPQSSSETWSAVARIVSFFGVLVVLVFLMNAAITSGLRRIKTSAFGASNQIMEGKVNADVLITGSSRALAHYDPRIIQTVTGHSAYNLGRNGSQTDMQVAFLKAYLSHNRKPQVVIHNLDAFSFLTTHQVYDPVEYQPYLYDSNLYDALRKINPGMWKSRYIPLYGYVVEDMNFAWVQGVKGFFGWSPREDYFQGFNPRTKKWGSDFEEFKAANPKGVSFQIEPGGVQDVEELIRLCKENGIQLIFTYSPEYDEMQGLTNNRAEIFGRFHDLANRSNIPFWDYSNWKYAGNQDFFQNSQHLNNIGAAVFSEDVANQLKTYFDAHSVVVGNAHSQILARNSSAPN
jgi:hypothetical protein